MEQVERMVAAGVGFGTAVREALLQQPTPLTLEAFGEKHAVNASAVSAAINGAVKPSRDVLAALAVELGGTPYEWRYAMWRAARPTRDGERGTVDDSPAHAVESAPKRTRASA